MAHTNDVEVLIVGAGPTGLTAAIELTLRGITIRIIDKVPPRPPTESRALGTNARSQEIFERQGSLAPMRAAGVPLRGFSFFSKEKRIARIDLTHLESPYPAMLHLRQAETEQVLLDRLAELGVAVERPVELTALSQDERAVRATLTRPDGQSEELTTSYLIGADGARSKVRKALGLEFVGEALGEREYLADVRVEWRGRWRQLVNGTDALFFLGSSTLGFGPLASGRWRAILPAPTGDTRFEHDHPTLAFLQELVDAYPGLDAQLSDLSWVTAFDQSARKVAELRHGRIFLAGDAAHIHSPFGGQGMNTGISDAVNLSWKLALRLRGVGGEALLNSYHAERNPILEQLLRVASGGPRFFTKTAGALRGPALRVASRIGPVQRVASRWLAGYTNHYRESAIVMDFFSSSARRFGQRVVGVRAGERAPDAGGLLVEGQVRRLFEVWAGDPRHYLFVFPGDKATPDRRAALHTMTKGISERYGSLIRPLVVEACSDDASEDVLADVGGELRRRYGGKTEQLYLVRPDGYVGFRSASADIGPLQAYLTRVFSL